VGFKIAGMVGDAEVDQVIAGMRAAYPDAVASEILFRTATL